MNEQNFRNWLDRYQRAWETRDFAIAETLFTADATYQETPFSEPFRGYEAIIQYGLSVNPRQVNIQFHYEILAVNNETGLGIAHWGVSFIQTPEMAKVTLDGIFVVRLNADGVCTEFREWWH